MTAPRTCRGRSCGALIRMEPTPRGAAIPLDAEPAAAGNVWLDDSGVAHVLTKDAVAAFRAAGIDLYMPHHATCPDVDQFRDAAGDTLEVGT